MDLQLTWYTLVALLFTGYAVLDGFDLGIGTLYPFVARNGGQKAMLRASIGPVWDGNEVWLITGGGALFAAFPPVYAMTFSGFYLAIMLVLFGLIVRAVALEFRHRDPAWRGLWDALFFVGSALPALLFGVAVGNIVRGVPLNAAGDYTGSFWGLLNPFSLVVGVTGLLMFLVQGAAWSAYKTEGQLRLKIVTARSALHWVFLIALIGLTVFSAFAVPERMRNVLGSPIGWLAIVLLAAGVIGVRYFIVRRADLQAFLASSVTIVGLMMLAAVGNYPALVPARGTPAATSLTVTNASSSDHALMVMAIIACIGVPIVLAYTAWIYRTFRGKVSPDANEY
jgi:cytochrome bd ubiquinol oxidase subunit II